MLVFSLAYNDILRSSPLPRASMISQLKVISPHDRVHPATLLS